MTASKQLSRTIGLIAVLLVLALGTWGYLESLESAGPGNGGFGFWDALYNSAQLFALGFVKPVEIPWQLQIARFLAPLATATAVAITFAQGFMAGLKRKWTCMRHHRVVFGIGRKGLAFIRESVAKGQPVVAVERDEMKLRLRAVQDLGVPVVIGGAAEVETLRQVGLKHASDIVVTCGDDDQNVEVTMAVLDETTSPGWGQRSPLRVATHISGKDAQTMLRGYVARTARERIELLDYCHETRTARRLFHDNPLDYKPLEPGSGRYALLIVIGFGRVGEAAAIQALKIAHHRSGELLHVHIFDSQANALWERFLGRYPNFGRKDMDPIARMHHHEVDVLSQRMMDELDAALQDERAVPTIVIALDGEARSIEVVERLPLVVRERQVPVHVRIHEEGGVSRLIEAYGDKQHRAQHSPEDVPLTRLSAFGQVEATATLEFHPLEESDRFARAIHAGYLAEVERYRAEDDTPGPLKRSQVQWEELDEVWRDSNRQAADFAPVLFRALGGKVVPAMEHGPPQALAIEDEAQEIAGELEHRRWYAERYLAGWRYAPERDDARKEHHCMVSWEELGSRGDEGRREQLKDIEQVLKYLKILRELKFAVVRNEAAAKPSAQGES